MSQPSSPRVHLALDTASPTTSIAVGASSQTAVERVLPLRRSGERLIPTVAELLDEQGLKTSDLASVIVLRGPGSFTGLRVGLATALGLHQALAMPIAIPSTMTVLAASTPAACVPAVGTPDNQTITAVVDALRGFWSAQRFTRHASDPLPRPIDAEPELLDAA
ncbi:MAG: tRNA (adenosine(37)-N6)-threonylcarbamoyltransferase complex dimerization subunit type 1 TsaB, partial [Acidobacteriota bacterium]